MYVFLADTGIRMYDLLNYISFIALIIFNLSQIKPQKENLGNISIFINSRILKSQWSVSLWIFAIIEFLIVSVLQGAFIGLINQGFGDIVGTGSNYFGSLFGVPIILYLWFFIVGVNPLREMDLITPAFPLGLFFVKLACFCAGCCSGKECSWGLYFPDNDAVLFPSQLLEALAVAVIFVFLLKYRKKAKEGTLFPIYMIIYCATRFFTEFTRIENEIFLIFKQYHVLCFIGVLVGILWFIIVRKYSDKILRLYKNAPIPILFKNKNG